MKAEECFCFVFYCCCFLFFLRSTCCKPRTVNRPCAPRSNDLEPAACQCSFHKNMGFSDEWSQPTHGHCTAASSDKHWTQMTLPLKIWRTSLPRGRRFLLDGVFRVIRRHSRALQVLLSIMLLPFSRATCPRYQGVKPSKGASKCIRNSELFLAVVTH